MSDAADDAIARPANVASLSALGLSALGIVFGDIGTSLRSLRCWFAVDSSLEGAGFEPSVPRKRTKVSGLPSFERSGRPPGSDQDSDPEYRPKRL